MNVKRFFFSWIFSTLVMFGASYLWHGVFLNDLEKIKYPKEIYLTGSVITYLILGFLLTRIYGMKYPKSIASRPVIRGIMAGAFLGFSAYVVSLVLGVSFTYQLTLDYILFDLLWQISEQILGGITVGLVYIAIYEGNPVDILTRRIMGGD